MEPGHEDREYTLTLSQTGRLNLASMEPGHEDREYIRGYATMTIGFSCLNGARS